jgi:diguanylate cyclase (GGDEF)-like protein
LHDLRGPISVIRGHARILLDGYKGELTDAQRRSVSAIERQVQRLGSMLEEAELHPSTSGRQALASSTFPVGSDTSPSILIADDDPEILELLADLLASRYRLTFARDGREALALLLSRSFQLTIVDIELPHLDGFALVDAARRAGEAPAFLFLSAHADSQAKVRALSMGAADYVTKPFDPDELAARVARVIATVNREASLRAEALTDQLTGLSNYRSLTQSLDRELERSRRYGEPLSLITLDLDHLKAINDEHGHDAGNDAICLVAEVLAGAVRRFEVVARHGGDEFAVLLPNTGLADAEKLAERLRTEIGSLSLHGVSFSASIGVACREKDSPMDARELVKASDEALYRAKRNGRDRVEVATVP